MLPLDVAVDDLKAAVTEYVALGATIADGQPHESVRVLFDPEGDPCSLYADSAPNDTEAANATLGAKTGA